MITCDVCRTLNEDTARSCIKCGTSLWLSGREPSGDISRARPVAERQQTPPAYTPPQAGAYTPPAVVAQQAYAPRAQGAGWRCPYCKAPAPPFTLQKISDAGWIVFGLMLLMCFPLFWIGLLMKEEQRYCSACRARLA